MNGYQIYENHLYFKIEKNKFQIFNYLKKMVEILITEILKLRKII